jgi:hypothetical protein
MAQIFRPHWNNWSKVAIAAFVLLLGFLGWAGYAFVRSSYMTGVKIAREQPVQFSHEHHVRRLGLDCRYCHTSVETSSFAGIPSPKTCMNCHSQLWTQAAILEPVRESFNTGKPLQWTRVHKVPDHVYFNHSIHVNKGVGCASCHGQVDRMPLMWKEKTLYMQWCLECHRHPEKFVRPRDQITNMAWAPKDQVALGRELVKKYNVKSLTDCYTCHR